MLEHLPDFKEAMQRFKVLEPIVLGYINVDIDNAQNSRSQQVVDLLMEFGLTDLVQNFRQRHRF